MAKIEHRRLFKCSCLKLGSVDGYFRGGVFDSFFSIHVQGTIPYLHNKLNQWKSILNPDVVR